jgi:succinate-semialdehyde dehydrogenase / glutarate-semialdehyde dehydrogenase
MAIATVNPATGETIKTFDPLSVEELDAKLARAHAAFQAYRLTTFAERAGWMRAAADILDKEADAVAAVMTTEMGKTLKAAKAEAQKCAKACRFYAERAEAYLADEAVDPGAVGAKKAFTRYLPIGPVLAVMPWNFPLWQAMRFAAPALMAGNVGLLKHASNVPQTALFMEDLFLRAGFPDGVFQTLLIGSDLVERVIRDPRVMAATLTGSTPAGQAVARVAGEEIKKTVLELGGSDPFVVLPSADLDKAAEVGVTARCQNNGQSCIAAKRFIVEEPVAAEFERALTERMAGLRVGDPMDRSNDLGPLAREDLLEALDDQVGRTLAAGAKRETGGGRLPRKGFFYAPTVLTGVEPGMAAFEEETFGPVAAVTRARDAAHAVELANRSRFGLAASVWTRDPRRGEELAREIEAGFVAVNAVPQSDPRLPFGGVKRSGYGRELAEFGIREFVNVKTVWVA